MNRAWKTALVILLLVSAVSPSWGWWRRGLRRGPRVGVYLGPGPWWYDPYYDPYYPYYYPYSPYYPAYPPSVRPSSGETQSSPDNSRHDLQSVNDQIARAREEIQYEFDDGDITRADRDAETHRLSEIAKEARAQAKANGGYLTGNQENALLRQLRGEPVSESKRQEPQNSKEPQNPVDQPHRDLKTVNEEIIRLRTLLDKKLAHGDITKGQHDKMNEYLARIDQKVQSDAAANGGTLTLDQENAVLEQLERVSDSINKDFVVN